MPFISGSDYFINIDVKICSAGLHTTVFCVLVILCMEYIGKKCVFDLEFYKTSEDVMS